MPNLPIEQHSENQHNSIQIRLFENADIASTLFQELALLVGDLEIKAKSGKKTLGPSAQGASIRFYNHDGFLTDTLMVAESNQTGSLFSYQERGVLYLLRYEPLIACQHLNRINNAGRLGGELGNVLDKQFFNQLRQSVIQ